MTLAKAKTTNRAAPISGTEPAKKKRKTAVGVQDAVQAAERLEDIPAASETVAGTVFVHGNGDCGQLGLGEDITEKGKPYPVKLPNNEKVIAAVAGGMHTACLTAAGTIYTWGVNDEGALGRYTEGEAWRASGLAKGEPGDAYTPGAVPLPRDTPRIVSLSAGDSHTIALTAQGGVLAWGTFRDSGGVMGFAPSQRIAVLPTVVWAPKDTASQVVAVASGTDHVAALCRDARVLTWGSGQQGQLGRLGARSLGRHGSRLAEMLTPHPMHLPLHLRSKPAAVACGSYTTFIVLANGVALSCGLNNYCQLGGRPSPRSADPMQYTPRAAPALAGCVVAAVASGEHHSLALLRSGEVVAFGRPTYGRLGAPDVDVDSDTGVAERVAVPVTGLEGRVTAVAAGGAVSGCTSDQECGMWFCGFGTNGQLGKGLDDDGDERRFRKVGRTKLFQGVTVTQLQFGGQHVVALGVPRSSGP